MDADHNMTPEEKARVKIDKMFEASGWKVVDREFFNPEDNAVAIREGLLKNGLEADYFLFIRGKAVGVLEAKREEVDAASAVVKEQAFRYAKSVPKIYKTYQNPLPFVYTSNGKDLFFSDFREDPQDLSLINHIHTPKEIVKMLGIDDEFAGLPLLKRDHLRDCQYEAISNLEKSFDEGARRALIVLATGAGKTFTACTASYRFLTYTPMKRILFLVDRNNLGKQAESEFGTYKLTTSGQPFSNIYGVERLKSAKIPKDANVVISTIHRLFSYLSGEDIQDSDEDDDNVTTQKVVLPPNPSLPQDYFDLIIVDECHRSIYGNWGALLDYFNKARIVGLTATPIPETLAFFNNNVVVNYTLEQSIVDDVNVDARIFRIKTEVSESGGAILEGDPLKKEIKYYGSVEDVRSKQLRNYTPEELNRSVINPAQIKLILETYRDHVYADLYPDREPNMDYIPKTLIFALNEAHANNIVKIAKEVFGREDDTFVQKITYSVDDSNDMIRKFRTNIEFRIAVTCTLVATGTDVKPLEVLIFMRDVRSEPLYVQMKGRGVRTISDDALRAVTPNAKSKDEFFLIDAVGVTEHEKYTPQPGTGWDEDQLTLAKLLELLTHGNYHDRYLRKLAGVLSRLAKRGEAEDVSKFEEMVGMSMLNMASAIFKAMESGLPPFVDINDPNTERAFLFAPLAKNPHAREKLKEIAAGYAYTIENSEDTLISAEFSNEEAVATTSAFETYCMEHKDELEALRIIYNNDGMPLSYAMLKDLEKQLRLANSKFFPTKLWDYYSLVKPEKVRKNKTKEEKEAITNIIQLVRFAYNQIDELESLVPKANSYFNIWHGRKQMSVTDAQIDILKQLVNYIATNGFITVADIRNIDPSKAIKLIQAYSNAIKANEALNDMSKFIIYNIV